MAYMPVVDSGPIQAARKRAGKARTVGEYLAAYGLAVIAPVLVFSGLVLHGFLSAEMARLEQQVLQTAQALKADVDSELEAAVLMLETLAASPSLAAGDYAHFQGHAAALARARGIQHISLLSRSGQPILDTRVEWGNQLPAEVGDPVGLRRVVETKRPYISDVLPNQSTFSVTVPILREGDVQQLLIARVSASRIADVIAAPRVPRGWNASVVDRQGNFVAGTSSHLPPTGAAVPSSIDQGHVGFVDEAGRDELRAVTRSNQANWLIAASVAPSSLTPTLWSWRHFIIGGATLLSLSLLLALYFGRRLAAPIRLTALAASAFGKGEALPQLGLRLREIDEVLKALETASAQRRLAEEQLRIAHERITLALSATDMGMWERDLTTNHVTWSEAMYRIFGRSAEEFAGDPQQVLSFIHPDDRARVRADFAEAVQGCAATFEQEFRIVWPSGAVRWLYRRAFVRRDQDGRAISVLGVAIDVTERKEAESANAHLAAIVASSSEAILSVTGDGLIATWNNGAEQTFAYSSTEAVGMPLRELFVGGSLRDHDRIQSAMAAGESLRIESLCRSKHGHVLEVSIVANPALRLTETDAAYSVTIRDISARKEHDRHLASVMRELTHRSKNLLAIIQAMARQTALRSEGLADFESRFSGRLQSLSRSHELLISNDWEGASLSDLVAVQKSALGARHKRIRAAGPDAFLRPEAILNIGLALHELATNAERHGALSVPTGRVDLTWSIERGGDGASRLMIVWRERGRSTNGDLLHRGFGRDILEHVTPTALGANVALKAIPDGLVWALDVPGDQFARPRQLRASA